MKNSWNRDGKKRERKWDPANCWDPEVVSEQRVVVSQSHEGHVVRTFSVRTQRRSVQH